MQVGAIVVAGGSGLRMGGDQPKQFMLLGGKPVLQHTLAAITAALPISAPVALILPPAYLESAAAWRQKDTDQMNLAIIAGGATRTLSVAAGLHWLEEHLPPDGLVLVHDGVRPFVRVETIHQVLQAAEQHGAATAAVPVKSSLRRLTPEGLSVAVDRVDYLEVQTPQAFRLEILSRLITIAAKACLQMTPAWWKALPAKPLRW